VDLPTFSSLKFGALIKDGERLLMVTATKKSADGQTTTAIAVQEAFVAADAGALTLIDPSYNRTFLQGSPDGKLVLMGETIQVTSNVKI
jgi:hypothetical protein